MEIEIICGAVLLIILGLWWLAARVTATAEIALGGVWTAGDDEFCEEAGISAMMLVIGEPTSRGWFASVNPLATVRRPAQLVILDEIHSGSFDLTYRRSHSLSADKYEIAVDLIPPDYETGTLWASPVRITIDIPRGLMVVVDAEDTIVACLSRDNAATEACCHEE